VFPHSSDNVTFAHVTMLCWDSLTLTCAVEGRTITLGVGMVEAWSTILNGHANDGTLVIARWRAQELRLLDSPSTT
jgi:hypothetical protein